MDIAYIILAFFIVSGLMLLHGKGSWLIAGYNTASKKEKEKYNEKKLCKSMGIMCLLISIIIGAMCYVDTDAFAESMIIPIFIIIGGELIYANMFCYKK